jgi:hypothetical protein
MKCRQIVVLGRLRIAATDERFFLPELPARSVSLQCHPEFAEPEAFLSLLIDHTSNSRIFHALFEFESAK